MKVWVTILLAASELDGFGAFLASSNPWFVAALSLMKCLGEGVVYIVDQDSAGSVTM